jgi:hypothetical protein
MIGLSVSPTLTGNASTCTATVYGQFGDAPTGSVSFYLDGSTGLGTIGLTTNAQGNRVAAINYAVQTPGTHTITAFYNSMPPFTNSSASVTQTVQNEPTSTTLTASANPSFAGQSVAFTAQIGGEFGGTPTGNVTFTDNGVTLGGATLTQDSQGAQAVLIAPNLPTGGHAISTIYNGDATFSGSLASLNQVVQTTTTTSLTTSLNPSSVTQSVTFTAEVVDPYSVAPTGTLTFMDGTTPLWAPIQVTQDNLGSHATFTTSSLSLGGHSITAVYSGGLYFVTSTSSPLNQIVTNPPPVVANPGAQSNVVGDDVFLPIDATVSDGDALTYSAAGLPNGLSIDPGSGLIIGQIAVGADNASPYSVTVTATDGAENASQTFAWTVAHFAIPNPGDQTNAIGDSVYLTTGGSDADGDTLTFTASNLPPGLTVDPGSGLITGIIANTATDGVPYTVALTASDGAHTASQTFHWTVNHILVANPGDQTNNDGDVVSLQVGVTDSFGDPLAYSATSLPSGLSINGGTGVISGTIAPTADLGGPYSVTVTASGGGYSNSQTFTWHVINPVSVTSVEDQINALGDAITLPISATTATGDTLAYNAAGLPPGVSINSSTGVISGMITNMASITTPYDVTVTVSDGAVSASENFLWTVAHLTLTNPGDQTNASGDTVSLGLTASDNMGDTPGYSATGLPPGLSINPATGMISGLISLTADAGTPYTVTASVTGGGYTATQTFSWAVSRIVVVDPGDQNSADGDSVSLQISAKDNNPDALTFSATGLPDGLSISAAGLISGVISSTADANGPFGVVVTATDEAGHSASDAFVWYITQLTLDNPGDQQNATVDTVSLQLQAEGPDGAALTYTATGLPTGLGINQSTGLISGTIDLEADSPTPYTVTVTASDGVGASDSETFAWTVNYVTVANPGDQTVAAGQTVSIPIDAHDNLGDAVTLAVTGLPADLVVQGVNILGAGLSIVGKVAASDITALPYNIVVTATNAAGASAVTTFTLAVDDDNAAPTLSFEAIKDYPKADKFGVYDYPGVFKLSSPATKDGFILQHVRRTATYIDPFGVRRAWAPLSLDYWEVLKVYQNEDFANGVRFVTDLNDAKGVALKAQYQKQYGTSDISDVFANSKGLMTNVGWKIVQIGEAYFVNGVDWTTLPGGTKAWKIPNKDTAAGDVPSRKEGATLETALKGFFKSNQEAFGAPTWHVIVSTWDAAGTTTLHTSPGDLGDADAKKLEGKPKFVK